MQKMDQLQLRDYQQECLNEHFRYFKHNTGNPLFCVPTGGGKSLIISEFLKVIFNTWKNQKVLILTHVKELIQQNFDEFCRHWGCLAPVGIYSAGLNRRNTHESAIFAGIQSVFNKAEEFGKVDLILIDECVEAGSVVSGRPIEEIEIGDMVDSFDHDQGCVVKRRVVAKRESISFRPSVKISTDFGELRCTDNHPVWVEGHGYKEASSIRPGQAVCVLEMQERIQADKRSAQKRASRMPTVLHERMSVFHPEQRAWRVHEEEQFHVGSWRQRKNVGHIEEDWSQTKNPRREGARSLVATEISTDRLGQRMGCREGDQDWNQEKRRSDLVFRRSLSRGGGADSRGRWALPSLNEIEGQSERCNSKLARVLHVEIQERGSSSRPVFNLQIDRTENFFVDGILTHNCHLVPKKGQGRYRSFIEDCRQINPSLKVLGYTATPYRLDGGYLHEGEGRIFTDIAYEVFLETLIEQKHLVPLVAKRTENAIDTSKVGTQTGDFKHNELEQAAMASGCVEAAVKELVDRAREEKRKHWLIFGCGHDHAHEILSQLALNGVYAQIILSTTPKDERRQIIKDAKEGKTTAIVNVGVLTTGFDWPRCDLLAVMRPTQSVSLYVQMMGRGMRTFPGKYNCLVLDYGTNVMRHGPINRVRVKGANKADSESDDGPKARECPECGMILDPEIKRCPGCGYDFPTRDADHEKIAGTDDPIDFSVRDFIPKTPVAHEVLRVYFDRHTKTDKPDSMKVSYQCGIREFREWICFEHGGYARLKASKWWLEHGSFPVPPTVTEALERRGSLRLPKSITIREEGKFDRIINRHFPIGMEEPIQSSMPAKSTLEDETEIPF